VVTRPAVSLAQDRESTPAEPAVLTTMLRHQLFTYQNGLAAHEHSVRENVCNSSKNVKSHVFWILKKNVKNVKTYVKFHRPLNHSAFNYSITASQYW